MAARLTLIKSVTSAIPIFTMQIAKVPVSVCDKLDKINHDFPWGSEDNKSKVHLVDWETVCLNKSNGGLGVCKTKKMSQTLLAKSTWQIHSGYQGL